jgi:two-component system, NarL family, response regulator NreC
MRVALVDDHHILRRGLREALEAAGLEVVAEASHARAACQLSLATKVDVFTIDIGMPGVDGFGASRELKRLRPESHMLMLTMYAREEMVVRAFASGATGYAIKDQPDEQLVEAVRTVAAGQRYIAPVLCTDFLTELLQQGDKAGEGPLASLSRRERDVFDLYVRGLSSTEVATHLFVSIKTVDTHRMNIFRKLDIHSMAELIRIAARYGLLLDD